MNVSWRSQFLIWALALAVPAVAPASVIFTNFGAGQTYDINSANAVGNGFDGNNYGEGESFTPTASANFGSVSVALSCVFGCGSGENFIISLRSDSSDAPGAAIESFIFTGATLGDFGSNNAPISASSVLKPLLNSGTRYWITVTSSLAYSIAWNLDTTGDTNDQALSTDGGATWNSPTGLTPGAFEVDSAAVTNPMPEPASGFLLTGGLLLGWLVRRRCC